MLTTDKKKAPKNPRMSKNTNWGSLEHMVSCEILPDGLWAFQNSVKQLFK